MKRNTGAIARKLEGERRAFDETADPVIMTDNQLWASIYRLQRRRNEKLVPRIRQLLNEQNARKEQGR